MQSLPQYCEVALLLSYLKDGETEAKEVPCWEHSCYVTESGFESGCTGPDQSLPKYNNISAWNWEVIMSYWKDKHQVFSLKCEI
jgi:hypothetical protein